MARKRRFVLIHRRAPGDIVTMTTLVRDLVAAHDVEVMVETTAQDVWRHNPHLSSFPKPDRKHARKPGKETGKPIDDGGVTYVHCGYGRGIRDQNYRPVHFAAYWHEDFERQTNLRVPLTLPYPDLHLSGEERDVPLVEGRYWVTLSGGKSDYPIKVWHADKLQEVVYGLRDMGLGVVQIGSNDGGHWHPPLDGENVIDMRGKTSLRDMMRLIHHADGVVCGVTCAMHMAAALQRPCVVIAGGREAWWWEAYVRENRGFGEARRLLKVPHRYLHTIGLLDCCRQHGCWKNKVVAINDDQALCHRPVLYPSQPIPLCMDMIKPQHVLDAVMKYYEDKTLPPITPFRREDVVPPPDGRQTPPRRGLLNLFDDQPPPAPPPPAPPPPAENGPRRRVKASTSIQVPKGMDPQEFLKKLRLNPRAAAEGRGDKSERPVQTEPGSPRPASAPQGGDALDHPDVGGRFTVCVLLYGGEEFSDMHRRCLMSIVNTVPAERLDLRVGSNALNAKSLKLVDDLLARGAVTKHYRHKGNDRKYPVMREMFHDPGHPITTKWVLWFDDDSIADRTPAWLNLLAQHIIQFHRRDNAHCVGAPFHHQVSPQQKAWFESRPWHRGKPWRDKSGKPSPNGGKVHFATGGFWAVTHEAIVRADIPDAELYHNGGDVVIGEQLYQAGFRIKSWNREKQFINTSSVPPRGESRKPGRGKVMPGQPGYARPKLNPLPVGG